MDLKLSDMTNSQLQAIVDLTEARILSISKDDLRMDEKQLLWSQALWNEVRDYWTSLNYHWKMKTLPPCTCADHENGFMAQEKYNPYFYQNSPCSIDWYEEFKASKKEKT